MANLEHLCCSDSDESDNGSTEGGKSSHNNNKTNGTVDLSLQNMRENICDSKDASFFSNIANQAAVLGTPPQIA